MRITAIQNIRFFTFFFIASVFCNSQPTRSLSPLSPILSLETNAYKKSRSPRVSLKRRLPLSFPAFKALFRSVVSYILEKISASATRNAQKTLAYAEGFPIAKEQMENLYASWEDSLHHRAFLQLFSGARPRIYKKIGPAR